MIVVRQVRKSFEGREVLAGIDVRFERGVTALVGPSGGGKSTLLRCVNGLERFESGAIDVGDLTLGPPTRSDGKLLLAVRRRVGMVFQHYGLFAHMTALANVMEAPVVVKRVSKTEARERACALLEKVGLTHRRDAFPRELSGGEQQRVAIARALAMAPEALLLDEPTSALDPSLKATLAKLLGELGDEGTAVVMVTHEPHVVRDVATRAFALEAGRVVREGTLREVMGASWQP